jgi:hypothetical protein
MNQDFQQYFAVPGTTVAQARLIFAAWMMRREGDAR